VDHVSTGYLAWLLTRRAANHLASLDDLVLLMDESHRYRASAGVRSINELKPLFGLEVTATPFVEPKRPPL
tara:strand:- start:779 stop:991 length:213 start_codon:yes stop_codon:yes gene_type:complete